MKEKILLILTFIISFTLYTNTVNASNECVNNTDELIDGYCCPEGYTSKLSTKNTKKICLDSKYSESELKEFEMVGDALYKKGEATIQGSDNPCDNKKYFNCNRTSYSGGQSTWSYKVKVGIFPSNRCYTCTTTGDFIWSRQEPNNTCTNGKWDIRTDVKKENDCKCDYGFSCSSTDECSNKRNWLKKCEYRMLGEEAKIYIYFDNCLMKIFKNNIDITESVGDNVSGKTVNDIKIDALLTSYNTNNSCPKYIYEYDQTVGSYMQRTNTHYSLKRKGENVRTYIYQTEKDNIINPGGENYGSCEELLDENTIKIINEVMKWIRIIVPILLIGLGTLDFAKATFAKSEDDMKKVREKFIKRIIAAVLVFLAPIFVNLLLELANSVWNWISPNTCIK